MIEGDTLLVVNGDTLCDLPLRALWDAHQTHGALVTLGLMPHPERAAEALLGGDDGRLFLQAVVTAWQRRQAARSSTEPEAALAR